MQNQNESKMNSTLILIFLLPLNLVIIGISIVVSVISSLFLHFIYFPIKFIIKNHNLSSLLFFLPMINSIISLPIFGVFYIIGLPFYFVDELYGDGNYSKAITRYFKSIMTSCYNFGSEMYEFNSNFDVYKY